MTKTLAAPLLLLAALSAACSSPMVTLGIGQNIHHDDFEYSVQKVDRLDRIGPAAPAGVFYVITFQVENRARRVDHEWDNGLAFLIDDGGHRYENDVVVQRQLNDLQPFGFRNRYVTSPGGTGTTKFVFDLPKDAVQPYLQVRGQTLMGDFLDGNQFEHTRIKLF